MGGVQEPLFDSALLDGQGSPKFQYSARKAAAAQNCTKLCEIILWETDAQSAEKKPACDNHDFRETNPVLLALFIPEVEMFKRKISCRIHAAPANRALSAIRYAIRGLPIASLFPERPLRRGANHRNMRNRIDARCRRSSRPERCCLTRPASPRSQRIHPGRRARWQCH
jgi:hypothetical protein